MFGRLPTRSGRHMWYAPLWSRSLPQTAPAPYGLVQNLDIGDIMCAPENS